MSIISLKTLAQQAQLNYFGDDVAIDTVSINSREIGAQALFVAVVAQRDGHDFIDDAIANGACALLLSQPPQKALNIPYILCHDTTLGLKVLAMAKRSMLTMPVIGLTGSCGKTTVKEMLALVLSVGGKVHATKGNLNNMLGVPMTILETPLDAEYAIYEAGTNSPGEIAYLAEIIQPDIAMITNIDAAHLEKLKTLDGVLMEKSALLKALKSDGLAIINDDDPRLLHYSQQQPFRVIHCAHSNRADIYVLNTVPQDQGFNISVSIKGVHYDYYLPLLGEYNILNSLLAIACADELGLPLAQVLAKFAEFKNYKGRFNIIDVNDKIKLIDDTYNASAPAMRGALETLARFDGHRIAVVSNMGELGEESIYYHEKLGEWCFNAKLDHLYLYGDEALLAHTQRTYGHKCYYADKQLLVKDLLQTIDPTQATMVLVKGSRANKMEEVTAIIMGSKILSKK